MSLTVPAIFIQTLFRSGGTYWFNKFQSSKKSLCYIEPLHENYRFWTHKDLQILSHPSITNTLRHPLLKEDSYMACPVTYTWFQDFHKQFDYRKRFYLPKKSNDDILYDYINHLISHAASKSRIPVLKFCRASLRSQWLKSKFNATSIYLLRNFDEQFESNVYLNRLTPYIQLLDANKNNELFSDMHRLVNDASIGEFSVNNGTVVCTSGKDLALYRSTFFFFWALSLLHNLECSDLIISHELMSQEKYNRSIRLKILEITGMDLDLSDFKIMRVSNIPGPRVIPDVIDIIKACLVRMEIKVPCKNFICTEQVQKDLELIL